MELERVEVAAGSAGEPLNPDAYDLAMRSWTSRNYQRPETVEVRDDLAIATGRIAKSRLFARSDRETAAPR